MTFWQAWRREEERTPEPFEEPEFGAGGWASDRAKVQVMPSLSGWYYSKLSTKDGWPDGIVAHYTATPAGTAYDMALRRQSRPREDFKDRLTGAMPGSWHFTVDLDGLVFQQLSLRQGGFHAGSKTARKLPVGWANHTCVGIELEGYGKVFSLPQVTAAKWLWRAIIRKCGIPRENAMFEHSWIDPTRRRDPGPEWMGKHAKDVLDHAYRETP